MNKNIQIMENSPQLHSGRSTSEMAERMGRWAPYYDFIMSLMTLGREQAIREMTINLALVQPGDKILEVGCGTGTLTLAAKSRVGLSGEVHGIDITPEMIEIARRKAARAGVGVTFQVGGIDNIPFPLQQFDGVLCSFMIFHMDAEVRRRGFGEIYRVLKPGGRLLVLDFAAPANPGWNPVMRFLSRIPRNNPQELIPTLEEAGFTEIEAGQTKYRMISFVRGRVR